MQLTFILLYMLCNYAYGGQPKQKTSLTLTVDPIKYADDKNFLQAGLAKKIVCSGSTQNQKVDWYDPSGKVVRRQPGGRIQVQDQVLLSFKANSRSKVLSIAHAIVPDSGVWECRSGALRANVSLCVIDPVEFIDPISEMNVDQGRSVTLSCKVKGDPEPTILWERNGEIIADDGTTSKYKVMTKYFSEGIEGLITVTSLDNTDSGIFTCVAYQENSLVDDCWNKDAFNISLNVNHAPFFFPDNETVMHILDTDESVEFICSATANPKPTYKWFYENGGVLTKYPEKLIETVENGTYSVLSIKPNLSNHEERYLCKASNAYGSAVMRYRVRALEEPHTPTELEIANVTYDSITVIWDIDETMFPVDSVDVQYHPKRSNLPPRQLQWKRGKTIQIQKYDAEPQVTIKDLVEGTEYWLRLRLANSAGTSEWTEPFLASTDILVESEEETNEETVEEGKIKNNKNYKNKVKLIPQKQVTQDFEPAFIGMFCLAAVVMVGVACMLVLKKLNKPE